MGQWQNALTEAETVIEKHGALEDMNTSKVLPNYYKSVENIMALEQVMTSGYVKIGAANKALVNSYRSGDKRKNLYFKAQSASIINVVKYGDSGNDGYRCSFRSAEAYLIAAEAEAQLAHDNATITDAHLAQARTFLKLLMAKRYTAANIHNMLPSLTTYKKPTC